MCKTYGTNAFKNENDFIALIFYIINIVQLQLKTSFKLWYIFLLSWLLYYDSSVLENLTKCKFVQFLCFYLLYICSIYMHAVKVKKYSNMTSFKRLESKPVVKMIYTHCNLWCHRQFIMIFYQFLHTMY